LRDPNAAMPTIGDFLCGGERRIPRAPLPSSRRTRRAWSPGGASSTRPRGNPSPTRLRRSRCRRRCPGRST